MFPAFCCPILYSNISNCSLPDSELELISASAWPCCLPLLWRRRKSRTAPYGSLRQGWGWSPGVRSGKRGWRWSRRVRRLGASSLSEVKWKRGGRKQKTVRLRRKCSPEEEWVSACFLRDFPTPSPRSLFCRHSWRQTVRKVAIFGEMSAYKGKKGLLFTYIWYLVIILYFRALFSLLIDKQLIFVGLFVYKYWVFNK